MHVSNIQGLNTLFLAENLGEAIKGTWEFRHYQHRLEVVRYFEPGHVTSGKVGSHLVDCKKRVFVVIDLNVHGCFKLEIGGDDTGFPVLTFKVGL